MNKIEYRDLTDLKINQKNPKKISSKKLNELVMSLVSNLDYFDARPIIIDKDGVVWGGNSRLKAVRKINLTNLDLLEKTEKKLFESFLSKFGINKAPVICLDLPENKLEEIMIRDNVQQGEWDTVILSDWNKKNLLDWGLEFSETNEGGDVDFPMEANIETDIEIKEKEIKKCMCPKCGYKFTI